MIISRTPLRISLVGGGSDIKDFYQHGRGAVLSTAINKYVYVTVHPSFDHHIRVNYAKNEIVESVDEIENDIVREALKLMGVTEGVNITYTADLPARSLASGLGASSAFAVGLLNALAAYQNKTISQQELAMTACRIEIDILKHPIGKQDQYAAALGNINHIQFLSSDKVEVAPLALEEATYAQLQDSLLLFYTGKDTQSSQVLLEQKSNTANNFSMLEKMTGLSDTLKVSLEKNRLSDLGAILADNWKYKKMLASQITNPHIDEYYERAICAGAEGGKILGSGGGGFLLFSCKPKNQARVRRALDNLQEMPFKFDKEGTKIIYSDLL